MCFVLETVSVLLRIVLNVFVSVATTGQHWRDQMFHVQVRFLLKIRTCRSYEVVFNQCSCRIAPPNNCTSLQVVARRTRGNTITVRWERPEITGRDNFYYNIFYSEDNQTFTQHNSRPYVKQDALVDYSVSGLQPLTTYTIRVIPENRVSDQEEGRQGKSCEVVAMTGDTSE